MVKPLLLFLFLSLVMALPAAAQHAPARTVAVTFDDLPFTFRRGQYTATQPVAAQLADTIAAYDVPAIGFVNEGKLYVEEVLDTTRVALLRHWLGAGLDLGNHTFSHPDLHRIPLADFERDVVRGEAVTRRLLAEQGQALRFFRHPFLHTGRDLATKQALEAFLAERGVRVAPVTIDNSEWIFALAYDHAAKRGDAATLQRIATAYVAYMNEKFDYFERESEALFGRPIPHVLLLHANALNAHHFGALAAMMQRRGYTFVALGDALRDAAYASADTYTGPGGITWLHRWALTRGVAPSFFAGEPRTPAFVLAEAGMESE